MSKKNNSEITSDAISDTLSAENTAENAVTAVENVENTAVNTAEISDSAIAQPTTDSGGSVQMVVYIGPTILRTDFVSGRVFRVHDKPLNEHYPEEFAKFPELQRLTVPLEALAKTKAKLLSGGNTVSEAYISLLKKIGG